MAFWMISISGYPRWVDFELFPADRLKDRHREVDAAGLPGNFNTDEGGFRLPLGENRVAK